MPYKLPQAPHKTSLENISLNGDKVPYVAIDVHSHHAGVLPNELLLRKFHDTFFSGPPSCWVDHHDEIKGNSIATNDLNARLRAIYDIPRLKNSQLASEVAALLICFYNSMVPKHRAVALTTFFVGTALWINEILDPGSDLLAQSDIPRWLLNLNNRVDPLKQWVPAQTILWNLIEKYFPNQRDNGLSQGSFFERMFSGQLGQKELLGLRSVVENSLELSLCASAVIPFDDAYVVRGYLIKPLG